MAAMAAVAHADDIDPRNKNKSTTTTRMWLGIDCKSNKSSKKIKNTSDRSQMSVPAWKLRLQEQEREREAARQAEDEARQRKLAELNAAAGTATVPATARAAVSPPGQFCTKCNFKDAQLSRFCTSCGAKLDEPSSPAPVTQNTGVLSTKAIPVVVARIAAVPTPVAAVVAASTNGAAANHHAVTPAAPVAARPKPMPPTPAVVSATRRPIPNVPSARVATPPVAATATAVDNDAQRRAKKQIVQLRKLGDAKLTKKRMFPAGFVELEVVVPRGLLQAGDTISVGVVVHNKCARTIGAVRVRLEQQTLVATAAGGHELHESITWRTFVDASPVPAQSLSELVVSCAIPRHTPPSGSRKATESNVDGRAAWFAYKLIVTTEAPWMANPTVLFDVELRGHPSIAPVGPGAPVPGSGAAAPGEAAAAAANARTRLTHSRRDQQKGSMIDMHCVGCGDRSLARICARCFGSGRAATFCAECGHLFTDEQGNAVDCAQCGTPRGVLPPGAPNRAASPPRRAGTERYAPRVKSPPPTPPPTLTAVAGVADLPPPSPRGTLLNVSKPTSVQRNPDAVKAMLAAAGVDASIVDSGVSSVSAPTDVQRNPDAVRAMLEAAGVDPSVVELGRAPSLTQSFSKPTGFQRNPDAVKALLVAAGVDASVVAQPSPAGAPLTRPTSAKQLPQIPVTKPAATTSAAAAAARPKFCMLCNVRPTAARVARHGKELYLCRECTLEQREKFKARGTINIGASPVRKGPRPPADPKPKPVTPMAPQRTNQYVDLELIPAPTAAQLERIAEVDQAAAAAAMAQQPAMEDGGEVEVSAVDVVGRCVARFEFVAEHESELTLREGDQIAITCFVDEEWLEGYIEDANGVRGGLFPKAYVRELAD
jgi:hypothetical protein